MDDVNKEAFRVLAAVLHEREHEPWGWAIAPDLRDDTPRNVPTKWVLDERLGAGISEKLAEAIRAEQCAVNTA